MKIFLDTNVIIDFYDRRDDFFRPASIIMDLAYRQRIKIVVSAITFVNAFYLLRKSYDQLALYNAMKSLSQLCFITPVNQEIIKECLNMQHRDFEDAVQFKSSQATDVDVIVTRNKKDYIGFDTKVQTPTEFLDDFFLNA